MPDTPPPLAPGAFRYARRVQFAETDLAGVVHFSWYLRYMEEAEHALWRTAGLSITAENLHWPRVTASAEYKQPLRFEDEIEVQVRAGFGQKRIRYEFEISRDATIAAVGAMTSVCARATPAGAFESLDIPPHLQQRLRAALR